MSSQFKIGQIVEFTNRKTFWGIYEIVLVAPHLIVLKYYNQDFEEVGIDTCKGNIKVVAESMEEFKAQLL